MNGSDQSNPRRLVRAIEIENWKQKQDTTNVILGSNEIMIPESGFWQDANDKLVIGLTAEREDIYKKINQRVEDRLKQGTIKEIQSLLDKGYSWELPALSALGYNIWQEYFVKLGQISSTEQEKLKNEITQKWIISEQQYAKRQLTWFKKEPGIKWFDVTEKKYAKQVLKEVRKWYNRGRSV